LATPQLYTLQTIFIEHPLF